MDSKEYVDDREIELNLESANYTGSCTDKGRLILVELLSKANAGYMNSHTEENYMRMFGMIRGDRTLNKRGRRFLCSMIYASSNRKAEIHGLIERFRK